MSVPTFKYVFRPENEPGNWNLRGDSELWRYLGALLFQVPVPRDPKVALQLVVDAVTNFTGWDGRESDDDGFPIDLSLFQNGAGMSTGFASASWWRDTGFPLIESLIVSELAEFERLAAEGE